MLGKKFKCQNVSMKCWNLIGWLTNKLSFKIFENFWNQSILSPQSLNWLNRALPQNFLACCYRYEFDPQKICFKFSLLKTSTNNRVFAEPKIPRCCVEFISPQQQGVICPLDKSLRWFGARYRLFRKALLSGDTRTRQCAAS